MKNSSTIIRNSLRRVVECMVEAGCYHGRPMKTLLAALLALFVSLQALPTGVTRASSIGGITEYDYPNGLRVLLYPDAAEPKITFNVTYLVGSRHEGYGETGMAHLLE